MNLRDSSPAGGEGDPRCPDPGKGDRGNLRAARLAAARDALLAMKHGFERGSRKACATTQRSSAPSPPPPAARNGRSFPRKGRHPVVVHDLLPRPNPGGRIGPDHEEGSRRPPHHLRRDQGDRFDPKGKDELRPSNSFAEKDPERVISLLKDRPSPDPGGDRSGTIRERRRADRVAPVEGKISVRVVDLGPDEGFRRENARPTCEVLLVERTARSSGREEAVPYRNRGVPARLSFEGVSRAERLPSQRRVPGDRPPDPRVGVRYPT